MPIMSIKYPRNVIHNDELKQVLGLPKKLPDNEEPMFFSLQGYELMLSTKEHAHACSDARKPHRLLAYCKFCAVAYPFGRLAQHERACKQKDNELLADYANARAAAAGCG